MELSREEPILRSDASLLLPTLGGGDELHGAAAPARDANRPREEHTPASPRALAIGLDDYVLLVLPHVLPVLEGFGVVVAWVQGRALRLPFSVPREKIPPRKRGACVCIGM